MPDYKAFFKSKGGYRVKCGSYGQESFYIEQLYQAFKSRLMDELKVKSPELLEYGELVDPNPEGEK